MSIITLQFGHNSNYVGSHFWNYQDALIDTFHGVEDPEVTTDCLYREGLTLDGAATYTPRAIIFDKKGSLGALRASGTLYGGNEGTNEISTWGGEVVSCVSEHVPMNDFLEELHEEDARLEGTEAAAMQEEENAEGPANDDDGLWGNTYGLDHTVGTWTDYLRPHLHPRTTHQLRHIMSGINDFSCFSEGVTVMKSPDEADDVETQFHRFAEECDSLRGFHALVDMDDGFGGLASSYLTLLRDEFPKHPVVLFGVSSGADPLAKRRELDMQALNHGLCLHSFVAEGLASVYLPLRLSSLQLGQFPSLQFDGDNKYHTSALLAAGIDTITLPYRLRDPTGSMASLVDALAPTSSMRVASLSVALPVDVATPIADPRCAVPLWRSPLLTPTCFVHPAQTTASPPAEVVVVRGCAQPADVQEQWSGVPWIDHSSSVYGCRVANRTRVETGLVVPQSFPRIIRSTVCEGQDVKSLTVAAHAYGGPGLYQQIAEESAIFAAAVRRARTLFPAFEMGDDEWEEVAGGVAAVTSSYREGASSDED